MTTPDESSAELELDESEFPRRIGFVSDSILALSQKVSNATRWPLLMIQWSALLFATATVVTEYSIAIRTPNKLTLFVVCLVLAAVGATLMNVVYWPIRMAAGLHESMQEFVQSLKDVKADCLSELEKFRTERDLKGFARIKRFFRVGLLLRAVIKLSDDSVAVPRTVLASLAVTNPLFWMLLLVVLVCMALLILTQVGLFVTHCMTC